MKIFYNKRIMNLTNIKELLWTNLKFKLTERITGNNSKTKRCPIINVVWTQLKSNLIKLKSENILLIIFLIEKFIRIAKYQKKFIKTYSNNRLLKIKQDISSYIPNLLVKL